MKLFRGLGRTDYQDILRAVGLFLDEREVADFRLIVHEDGLIVQVLPGHRGQPAAFSYDTILLTDEDLQGLLTRSYRRRGGGPLPERPVASLLH